MARWRPPTKKQSKARRRRLQHSTKCLRQATQAADRMVPPNARTDRQMHKQLAAWGVVWSRVYDECVSLGRLKRR